MTIPDKGPNDIVELLAEHEEAIAKLYNLYGQRFAEHGDFWRKLSGEEIQHANMLRRLKSRIEAGEGRVVRERFDIGALQESLGRINANIERAAEGEFGHNEAIETAAAIEGLIVESRYYEVFEGNCPEIVQVQYYLGDAAEDHRQRVLKAAGELA
jgi:hypothetical protein